MAPSKPQPPPPTAPPHTPPLPGIFEDYFFVEMYLINTPLGTPMDLSSWYIGAIPVKALGKTVNATGFVSYAYDEQSGLLAIPYVFKVTLTPDVERDDKGNPVMQGGQPIPTTKMVLKYVGDVVMHANAISHIHQLHGEPRNRDWSMMALQILQQSMSKIERPNLTLQ